MTFLCLETSLQCRRVIDTLCYFCPNLVSRNSTATTVSMHGIVSLLKPRCNMVTHPPKGDRDKITCVFTTCDSGIFDTFQGTSTPSLGDQLAGHALLECSSWNPFISSSKAIHDLTVPTIQTLGQICIPRVCQESESRNRKIEQSHTGSDIALDDAPCKASVRRERA